MIVAIQQNNFFPWSGYFHKIKASDVFVLLDNVDIMLGSASSITNRTKIKTIRGEQWLTVPLKKSAEKTINKIVADEQQPWRQKHLKTIYLNYGKTPFFPEVNQLVQEIYRQDLHHLSAFNSFIIQAICDYLGIATRLVHASSLQLTETDASKRLVEICMELGADTYYSGRGAKKYMDLSVFERQGISVSYTGYVEQERPQPGDHFIPGLSILDLLFNCGRKSVNLL